MASPDFNRNITNILLVHIIIGPVCGLLLGWISNCSTIPCLLATDRMSEFNQLKNDKDNRQQTMSFPLELLRQAQEQNWASMARSTLDENPFYRKKFADVDLKSVTLDRFDQLPLTLSLIHISEPTRPY